MGGVATTLEPLVSSIVGTEVPVRVQCWDGTGFGPADSPTILTFRSPEALRRILWAPGELGLARAYVAGEMDVDGDIFGIFRLRDAIANGRGDVDLSFGWKTRLAIARAAWRLGALRRPLPPPPEEAGLRGIRHSKARDANAIRHHYDVSNDFYALFLGPSMTYSCAYFASDPLTLDEAQEAKYELVCRKLSLEPGMRLLDVGCGWGGLVMHAARTHDVTAVGVTISRNQAELAEKRIAEAGLADRVQIRLQDYRDIDDGPFDAISSIGMFEHVGLSQLERYFSRLRELLRPRGRLLNHAISRPRPDRASFDPNTFIARYVFPDGELHEVGTVVSSMQKLGFEVRDVHSLREHYARTLRAWVTNLESRWERSCELAGEARARVWRLYMAGSADAFEAGRINVHQVLGVLPDRDGASGMPPTRSAWEGA